MKRDYKYIVHLFILILLSSCYEPATGCLDSNSSNFDVNADKACDDCCTLPNLGLNITYRAGEDGFDTILYRNNLGVEYKVLDFFMNFYNIGLTGDVDNYGILAPSDNPEELDLAQTSLNSKSASLGHVLINDSIRNLEFSIGIPEALKDTFADFDVYPELVSLFENEEFNLDGDFYAFGLDVITDTITNDTINLRYLELDNQARINIELEELKICKGRNISINLNLFIDELFMNVRNEDINDNELLKRIISENLILSIKSN